MVVIDTNILIDHIRRSNNADSYLVKLHKSKSSLEIAISIITIQELYVGQSSKTSEKEQFFLRVINSLKVLPYDGRVAKFAGEIIRDTKPQVQFADAAIAATAILNKASLFTLNKKDFQGIKNLKLETIDK